MDRTKKDLILGIETSDMLMLRNQNLICNMLVFMCFSPMYIYICMFIYIYIYIEICIYKFKSNETICF